MQTFLLSVPAASTYNSLAHSARYEAAGSEYVAIRAQNNDTLCKCQSGAWLTIRATPMSSLQRYTPQSTVMALQARGLLGQRACTGHVRPPQSRTATRRRVACAPMCALGSQGAAAKKAQKGTPGKTTFARGSEWLQHLFARFGPARDRAQNITTLEFEKPLLELEKRILEVRLGPIN